MDPSEHVYSCVHVCGCVYVCIVYVGVYVCTCMSVYVCGEEVVRVCTGECDCVKGMHEWITYTRKNH